MEPIHTVVGGIPGEQSKAAASPPASPPAKPKAMLRRRPAMSPDNIETVARMMVTGAPVPAIAAAIGWSKHALRAALDGHKGLQRRCDSLKGDLLRANADHHVEMMEMLPNTRRAIRDGLTSKRQDLQLQTAKWVHETLISKPAQRTEANLHVSGTLKHDLTGVLEQIGTALVKIQKSQGKGLDRVLPGSRAIIRPQLPSSLDDSS